MPDPTDELQDDKNVQTPEARLSELGLELPEPITPVANYLLATRADGLIFVSGHGPASDGEFVYRGKVSVGDDLKPAQAAAQLTMLNMLSTLRAELGALDRVTRVLKLLVLVNSAPEFIEQHVVANGASDLLIAVFGSKRGSHARSAVGMVSLPFDMTVEIEGVFGYAQ